jgi:hypothetical protein
MEMPKVLTFRRSLRKRAVARSLAVQMHSPQQPVVVLREGRPLRSAHEWPAGFSRLPSFDPQLVITGEAIE